MGYQCSATDCPMGLYLHNLSSFPAQVPFGARCTFEDGMCGWINTSDSPEFRWMRVNGSYKHVLEQELGRVQFADDHTYQNVSGRSGWFAKTNDNHSSFDRRFLSQDISCMRNKVQANLCTERISLAALSFPQWLESLATKVLRFLNNAK